MLLLLPGRAAACAPPIPLLLYELLLCLHQVRPGSDLSHSLRLQLITRSPSAAHELPVLRAAPFALPCRYYLENQLSGPLTRIFEGIIDNPASLFSGEHTRTITVSLACHVTSVLSRRLCLHGYP